MAKVLLVDTGFSSVPIYEELNRLGYEVHVVGDNPNDCLAKISENYWNINYSNLSDLNALLEKENFNHIVPGCNDVSYSSCATLSNGKFPGLDKVSVNQKINNKASFRSLAVELDLPSPKIVTHDTRGLDLPLIAKPVDSFSGKGISIIEVGDAGNLQKAIDCARGASLCGQAILEEYVVGQLYSHSAFIKEGQIIDDFIVQEDSTANRFVVDTSRLIYNFSQCLYVILRSSIEKVAKFLRLTDGLLHTQFIANDGKIWIIEATRRCPGDLYSQLIELSTGYPYISNYVRPFLNLPVESHQIKFNTSIMRHTVSVPSRQIFTFTSFNLPMIIRRWVPLSLTGDMIEASPKGRIGILFVGAESEVELDRIYSAAIDRRLYKIA